MEAVLLLILVTLVAATLALLGKYYRVLKKLRAYEGIEERRRKILDHKIESEISRLKEDVAMIRERLKGGRGLLRKIRRVLGGE
jgi:hypothetical protein